MKRNERHSHNPKSMQRDNKESGSIFLVLGLGGYGIYLVLYFGNYRIICRFMDFNFLTRNGVNEMRTVSYIHRKRTVSPFIRLSGKSLKQSGFQIGGKYTVEYKQGEIILRSTK